MNQKNKSKKLTKKMIGNVPEHTQIIQFINGVKKTIQAVVRIDEGELLRLTTKNGKEFLIDKSKVLWIERYIDNIEIKNKKNKKIKIEKIKVLVKKLGYSWYGEWIDDNKDHGATTEKEVEIIKK
jgi:hypothetical protein